MPCVNGDEEESVGEKSDRALSEALTKSTQPVPQQQRWVECQAQVLTPRCDPYSPSKVGEHIDPRRSEGQRVASIASRTQHQNPFPEE